MKRVAGMISCLKGMEGSGGKMGMNESGAEMARAGYMGQLAGKVLENIPRTLDEFAPLNRRNRKATAGVLWQNIGDESGARQDAVPFVLRFLLLAPRALHIHL
jgi:hypothetical protein